MTLCSFHGRAVFLALAFLAAIPAEAAAEPSSPVSVIDALGRTVTFSSPPRRIAVAGRAVTLLADTLYLFPESRERVVAIPGESAQPTERFLSLLDPGLPGKALAGGSDAGPEQIAPYKPDVVILKSSMASRLGEPLGQLGLKVVYLDGESPERFDSDILVLGKLLGNADRANAILSYFRVRTERVAARLKDFPTGSRPRVLLLTVSTRGGDQAFHVPPGDWLQARMISAGGGLPVPGSSPAGTRTATIEQVAAWNPDVIFVAHYRGDSKTVVERLRQDPIWRALPAVKSGRLHAFPGDFLSWDQPDPRWILGQLWLASKLHPGRFSDLDMKAEVLSFFREMYGLSEETVRARIVPVLTGDIRW